MKSLKSSNFSASNALFDQISLPENNLIFWSRLESPSALRVNGISHSKFILNLWNWHCWSSHKFPKKAAKKITNYEIISSKFLVSFERKLYDKAMQDCSYQGEALNVLTAY